MNMATLPELDSTTISFLTSLAASITTEAGTALLRRLPRKRNPFLEIWERAATRIESPLGLQAFHLQKVRDAFRAEMIHSTKDLAEVLKQGGFFPDHIPLLLTELVPVLNEECRELARKVGVKAEQAHRIATLTDHDRQLDLLEKIIALLEEPTAVPSPWQQRGAPNPYLRDVSSLPEYWTGRQAERDELDAWLRSEDNPMCCLLAMGGTGKSTLSWSWLDWHVVPAQEDLGLEGIFQCSFYEGELGFERFLSELTAYLGLPPQDDPVTAVTQQLLGRRILLVLDGFERLLHAYASVDAALLPERAEDELEPSDRRCPDRMVVRLLRGLLREGATKTLVISRLRPEELDDQTGYVEFELRGLDPADAVAYLEDRGIKGPPSELETEAECYGFHPLSLDRLVNALHYDPELPDDIRAAHKWETRVARDLKAIHQHVLERAYNTLPDEIGQFLSGLAAMRQKATMTIARHIAEDWPDTKLSEAIQRLEEDRWLKWDREAGTLEMHPLVRRYAYLRLEDKVATHNRLAEFFFWQVPPGKQKVESLEDLAPVIELYHHTARAGRYDEAMDLFYERLSKALYYRLGAYQTRIELLRALFPDGEDRPPRLKSESDQAWTLNGLANSYSLSGQSRRAVPLFKRLVEVCERGAEEPGLYTVQEWKRELTIGLVNLAADQLRLGELEAAEQNLHRRNDLCREIQSEFDEAAGNKELGRFLSYQGAFDEAAEELASSTTYWDQTDDIQGLCLAESYRALCALLMGEPQTALEAARRARELADEFARTRYPVERDRIRAEWLLGWALVALAEESSRQEELLTEAEAHLTEALTRCRCINMVDHEAEILLAWARWHRLKGNPEEAHQHAEEALTIADRCEYRLQQAETHNFLARLALDAGDKHEALHHAQTARERAECDGPPHYYKPAYEEAERLLDEAERLKTVGKGD